MAKQRGTGSGYNYKRDLEHAQEGTSHVVQQSRQQSNAMVVAHLFISPPTHPQMWVANVANQRIM